MAVVTFAAGSLGLTLQESTAPRKGVWVKALVAGGQAEVSGRVEVGDTVYSVGGTVCAEGGYADLVRLVKEAGRPVDIAFA